MVKCVRFYSRRYADNSCIEIAKSETGNWFTRQWGWTKYGFSCSSWSEIGNLIKVNRVKLKWENLNGNELKEHLLEFHFKNEERRFNPTKVLSFHLQDKSQGKLNYRLPY